MKNDKLFRNSIIFANLALFAILCYTAFLDAATATGQVVIYTGVMLTAAVFVALCDISLNRAEHRSRKLGTCINKRLFIHA